jgi:hypothetical protein
MAWVVVLEREEEMGSFVSLERKLRHEIMERKTS